MLLHANSQLAHVGRVLAIAIIALALVPDLSRGAVQTMYGNYLAGSKSANGNYLVGEVSSAVTNLPHDRSVAVHFRVYQQAPSIDFHLESISCAFSHPASESWAGTGDGQILVQLWSGSASGPSSMIMTTTVDISAIPSIDFESPFAYARQTFSFASASNLMNAGGDYWIVIRFDAQGTGHTLNWHNNAAGVSGLMTTRNGNGTWATATAVAAQPSLKVRGFPKNEPCPNASFLSAAVYGPPATDAQYELHLEVLCPPKELQYFNCASVMIPAGTNSYDAANILVQAVQNSNTCYNPGGAPFRAERSGNVVRVTHTPCPCAGAYVCSDPGNIITFAKTAGYQNDGNFMPVYLFFGGLASGIPEDPNLPGGVTLIHTINQPPLQPVIYTAVFSPGAGATPENVVDGLEAALLAAGDPYATGVGDHLLVDGSGCRTCDHGVGYFDFSYRINDTGLHWVFTPFDDPSPFVAFAPSTGPSFPTMSMWVLLTVAALLIASGAIFLRRT